MKEIIVAVIGLGAIVLFFYTIYYLLFRYGQSPRTLTPKQLMDRNMICPHCQTKGYVTTQQVKRKSGIHGGKATAALLTCGISLLGTGLSRKHEMTEASCGRCGATWTY